MTPRAAGFSQHSDPAAKAYCEMVINAELVKVTSAKVGTRNNTLNKAAFAIGQLLVHGLLLQSAVEKALLAAALSIGLVEAESVATIKSGILAGLKESRLLPPGFGDTEPADLWARYNPPLVPKGLLPRVIEDYASAQAGIMGVDPAGPVAVALVTCAAAIPDHIKLQVKQYDPGWTESARMWVALVGSPSTKKTPIISNATHPLCEIDERKVRDHVHKQKEYEKLDKEGKATNEPPKLVRYRLEDTTIEAAQVVLSNIPDGILVKQDELGGWFGSMEKYSSNKGSQKDRSFWLQTYNGGPYTSERIGRGTTYVSNLSVCLIGGIQPEPIRAIAREMQDDGLLQRLFPIVLQPAREGRDQPDNGTADAYRNLVRRLVCLSSPSVGETDLLSVVRTRLMFDNEAQLIRSKMEQRHLELMSLESINAKLASHIGKYDGLFARLCIVWHCIEHAHLAVLPKLISADTARRVAEFLHGFFLPNAVCFYVDTLGLSDSQDALVATAGYILAHPERNELTLRDISRGDGIMRNLDRNAAIKVLDQLEILGWLDRVDPQRNQSKPRWAINQLVHARFAEHGRSEAERRMNARNAIAQIIHGQSS